MKRYDALLWARTPQHRAAVDRSKRIIADALRTAPSWYVAFSGGKDSTCVLSLVRAAAPETPAVTSVRQWDLPETEAILAQTANLRRVTYEGFNNGEPWVARWDSRKQARERHPDIVFLSHEQIMARGASEAGVFLGLRAQEASYRKKHLLANGILFDCQKSGKVQCNPIAWWTVLDVWGFILSNGVPYNAAYDVMERMRLPLDEQRVGPFDAALGSGALAILKRGWPEQWNRIAARHPEARQYA